MSRKQAFPAGQAPIRILIVDDQPANVLLAHQILGGQWPTFAATSGAQALGLCRATPPDLILLDVNMPDMDGLETCRRLKADPATADIPVIFVTAGGSPADEDACWSAGAADFVAKPINPNTLRNRVRVHLALKQQADRLRTLAFSDALTGLANRRHFDLRAADEWQRARRSGAPLSVLLIDVDYFKRFNDRYGHPAGDRCLAAIGAVLDACAARSGDLAARYGGEEFIILLPGTGRAGALAVAEAISSQIRLLAIAHEQSDAAGVVTVSVGVASMARIDGTAALHALIDLADRQLYRAKCEGRGRVALADA